MTDEISKESSAQRDRNKGYAIILLLAVIAFVHSPSLIIKSLWVEEGVSNNDFVVSIFLPGIELYLMLLFPMVLLLTKPRFTIYDYIWFRWTRSELIKFPLLILGVLLVTVIIYVSVLITHPTESPHFYLRNTHSLAFWIWILIRTALLSPFVEEIFFRGYVQGTLARAFHPWKAILMQAILFGLMHLGPTNMIRACLLGLVFGIWCHKRKTLLPVIIMHVIINSVAFALRWPLIFYT